MSAEDTGAFPTMCDRVAAFLSPCSRLTDAEREYFRLLDESSAYHPDLLFSRWPQVLERAEVDPVMQWKLQNLRKRTGESPTDQPSFGSTSPTS